MVWKADDSIGVKFNSLTVIKRIGTQNRKPMWLCECDCGNETQAISANLKNDAVKSCGCLMRNKIPRIIKNCKICNTVIKVKPSHILTEGSYCSKECMALDYKNKMIGKNNPNYKHGMCYTKEYRLPFSKTWRKLNKDKVKNYNRNMKAKRANAKGNHTHKDIQTKLWLQNYECYWCYEILNDYEIDHVVPLSKGGSNCKDNVVVSCHACNRQKHDSLVTEWYSKNNCRAKRQNFCLGKYSVEIANA